MKRNLTRILSAALSLIMIMSVFMLPANAAKVDDCKGQHVDNTGDYMCDNCGIFVGKVTGLKRSNVFATKATLVWDELFFFDGTVK